MVEIHVPEGAYVLACESAGVMTRSTSGQRYRRAVDAAAPLIVAADSYKLADSFASQASQVSSVNRMDCGRLLRLADSFRARAEKLQGPGVVCLPVAGYAAGQLEILANQINQEATVSSRSGQMERLELLANQIREVARGLRW